MKGIRSCDIQRLCLPYQQYGVIMHWNLGKSVAKFHNKLVPTKLVCSHITNNTQFNILLYLLSVCRNGIQDWFRSINMMADAQVKILVFLEKREKIRHFFFFLKGAFICNISLQRSLSPSNLDSRVRQTDIFFNIAHTFTFTKTCKLLLWF